MENLNQVTALKSFFNLKDNRIELLVKSIECIEDYAIFILDQYGHIQTWNQGAKKIKGYLEEEILGKHFSLFYTDDDIGRFHPQKGIAVATEKGKFEDEGWRLKKNGEKFWAHVTITALKDDEGKVIAFSKVTRDLTEKKAAEAQLKLVEEKHRISVDTDKSLISELQDSIRMRDEFISVASHELRTPVTKILLNLQMIKRNSKSIDEKTLKSLDVSETATKELITLMDNLVDVTRLRLGKLEVKRTKTNITQIALHVLTKFKDQIRLAGNHVSFVHDGDIVGYWDQTRLEQLFSNLLSNAIKFTDGQAIRMELRKKDELVTFIIEDDGPGISNQMQTRVFERFERAVDSRKASGLGLGLYVARQIVEAHKGEINLQSEKGKGTRFTVHLPLKQEKK